MVWVLLSCVRAAGPSRRGVCGIQHRPGVRAGRVASCEYLAGSERGHGDDPVAGFPGRPHPSGRARTGTVAVVARPARPADSARPERTFPAGGPCGSRGALRSRVTAFGSNTSLTRRARACPSRRSPPGRTWSATGSCCLRRFGAWRRCGQPRAGKIANVPRALATRRSPLRTSDSRKATRLPLLISRVSHSRAPSRTPAM